VLKDKGRRARERQEKKIRERERWRTPKEGEKEDLG
jgi:hypothetical protein